MAALAALPAASAHAQPAGAAAAARPATAPAPQQAMTAVLASYAASTTADSIAGPAKERARKVIFDEIASAYFGRRSPGGELAAKYVARLGGAGEARIYGTALRAPVAYAAMANGTAGHGDEVDGTHVVGGHPGASIVHAATAIAERQRVSGAELLNAVVLGYDVGVRIVEACGGKFAVREAKDLTSDFLYAFGTTALASRILKLDGARVQHALALVSFQVNGLNALYDEKHHISKSFCNGQYAFAGISAAYMAEVGLEGNEDIIGAKEGVLDAWGDGKNGHAVTAGLGTDFKIMGANFKFYNAGYPIHTALEASQSLVTQYAIKPGDIAAVIVGMPANALRTVNDRDMHNISVQDMVSANLATGGLKLVDYPFPEILKDANYQRIRASIRAEVDPEIQREFPNGRGARVTILLRNGQRRSLRINNPLGHSLRGEPSWEELGMKWRGSLPNCDTDKALELARRIDALADARELFDAFSGVNA